MKNMKILIIVLFSVFVVGRLLLYANAKHQRKTIYTITINNFNSEETFFTDSIVSQEPNKIVFFDGFGRKQTITSPGISVTQY